MFNLKPYNANVTLPHIATMNTELKTRWTELVAARADFFKELEKFSEAQFHQLPQHGWSAAQVVEHVLGAETGTLGYMRKKSSSGWDALEKTGDEHIAKSKAVNTRLASPEKYAAPSILNEPTNQYSKTQLIQQWNQVRMEMEQFLGEVDPMHNDKLVFRQPIAGMLNVLQAVEFMHHHLRHHIPQLHRIMTSVS